MRGSIQTGGNFGSPKIDLGGCVYYAPLWRPEFAGSTFKSSGVYGLQSLACTPANTVWDFQNGLLFNATNSDVDLDAVTSFDSLDALTLYMWYKPNIDLDGQGTHRTLASFRGDGLDDIQLYYSHSTNDFRCFGNISSGADLSVSPAGGTDVGKSQVWHLIVMSLGAAGASIEIDLAAYATSAGTQSIKTYADSTPTTQFRFGDFTSARSWPGNIGDILLFDNQHSASQKSRIHQSTKWRYQ